MSRKSKKVRGSPAPAIAAKLQAFLIERFPELTDSTSTIRQTLAQIAAGIQAKGGQLAETLLTSAMSLVSALVFIVVVPVVAFYMLLDWDHMVARIDSLLPRDHAPVIRQLAREIDAVLAGFVRGQISVCLTMGVFYAVGLHPMSVAESAPVSLSDLVGFARHPKMVGIGETGLDYHYTPDSAEVQKTSLRLHITAAQETGLPLIIHARAADEDMAEILTAGFREKPYTCVMHCFSSGAGLARAALDLGFYLSMSGIATFPKSQELRDIFAAAPLDRILLETDSPYLAPIPHRGKRNEPAYTAFTAAKGAEVFGIPPADFARITTENFDRLFWKAKS